MPSVDTVLCFDRDHTVDVNPHPEKETVPLSWVWSLAHHAQGVDVWATGNQMLAVEARVPDREVASRVWNELRDGDVRDRHYDITGPLDEIHPPRDGGLRIIEDLYASLEVSPQFIVVDDHDLSEFAASRGDWTYYEPWTFTAAVRDGTVDFDGGRVLARESVNTGLPASFHHPAPVVAVGVDVRDIIKQKHSK